MIDPSVPMKRNPVVLHRVLIDEAVIFHPKTDQVVTLDAIGSIIWQVLEEPGSIDDLVPDLVDAFGADPDRVRSDVAELFDRLVEHDMIVVGD